MHDRSLFQFPCTFPLKVIGKDENNFETFVISIVRKHVPEVVANTLSRRPSAGGTYLAITITFTAESKEQLDALYMELGSNKRVTMVL